MGTLQWCRPRSLSRPLLDDDIRIHCDYGFDPIINCGTLIKKEDCVLLLSLEVDLESSRKGADFEELSRMQKIDVKLVGLTAEVRSTCTTGNSTVVAVVAL